MATRGISALRRRLDQIERLFLPAPNPTSYYSADDYDRVRAYVMLAHAEFEGFLEQAAYDILDAARKRWLTSGRAGRCIAALMMYSTRKIGSPESLVKQEPKNTFDEYAKWLTKEHRKQISENNHGIKEKNILSVFLPIGFLEDEFDKVWLGTTSTFGTQRGIVAHTSARTVKTPLDPQIAKSMVMEVFDGIQALEPLFAKLRRS